MKKLLVIATLFTASTIVYAGGYRVSLQGQRAQGMGHTGVALTDSAETVFFNPGSTALLESDREFTGGLNLLNATSKYQNANTGTRAETDSGIATPLNLYYNRRINDKLSWGFGIYTPYGSSVEWDTDWAGSHLVNEIELASVFFQPTLGYRVNDAVSVGFGPALVVGGVEFNRNLSTSLVDENGNRANVTLEASEVTSYGFNFGLLATVTDRLNAGINYRSKVDLEARGESATFSNVPASLQGTFTNTTFDADLVLPAELTVGLAYDISDKTTFAFDVNRAYWSDYEELRIEFANSVPTSVNPRNYKDANTVRLGLSHKRDDKWTLRGGYYIDKTPVRDGYFAPETPRPDSTGFTLGATYQSSPKLAYDFSFLYLRFPETDNSYDFYVENGTTTPFAGTYLTNAYNVGFGLTYRY
ncbi:MAG: outer membrane protein transport protein [Pseudomonadota bacterium]